MDSGLFIGWVFEMALVCFALSAVLHGVLGRVALWSILASGTVAPALSALREFGCPPCSSDFWSQAGIMAAFGSVTGLTTASLAASAIVGLRRVVSKFIATLHD
jgi:hypothetical protein